MSAGVAGQWSLCRRYIQTFLFMQLGRKIITVLSNENKGRHPCAVRLSLVTSMLNTMTAYKIADEKLMAKHLKKSVIEIKIFSAI